MSGVYSWEPWTPDIHLYISKAKYPCLGGVNLSVLPTATIDTEVPIGVAHPISAQKINSEFILAQKWVLESQPAGIFSEVVPNNRNISL